MLSSQLSHPRLLDMWKERPFPEGVTFVEDKHICWLVCHILEGFGCGAMERPHKVKGWETFGAHLRHDMKILATQTNGDCLLGFTFNKYSCWTNFQVSKSRLLCFGMPITLICCIPNTPLSYREKVNLLVTSHFSVLGNSIGNKTF